jgi:hypothetical protein
MMPLSLILNRKQCILSQHSQQKSRLEFAPRRLTRRCLGMNISVGADFAPSRFKKTAL